MAAPTIAGKQTWRRPGSIAVFTTHAYLYYYEAYGILYEAHPEVYCEFLATLNIR